MIKYGMICGLLVNSVFYAAAFQQPLRTIVENISELSCDAFGSYAELQSKIQEMQTAKEIFLFKHAIEFPSIRKEARAIRKKANKITRCIQVEDQTGTSEISALIGVGLSLMKAQSAINCLLHDTNKMIEKLHKLEERFK